MSIPFRLILILLSLLLFVLAPIIGVRCVDGTACIPFKWDSFLISVSAAMFTIVFLTYVYQFIEEERTVKYLKDLMGALRVSKEFSDIGIESIRIRRSDFNPNDIERRLANSNNLFFMSINFAAIAYAGTKKYFRHYLDNGDSNIKLLIHPGSKYLNDIMTFRNSLPQRNRFDIRTNEKIINGLYGSDDTMYITLYSSLMKGDESPTILCKKMQQAESTLYNIYREEFDELWNNGTIV